MFESVASMHRAFTRTPWGASTRAHACVKPLMPHLEASYTSMRVPPPVEVPGGGVMWSVATLTIWPPPMSAMCWAMARPQRNTPRRLTPTTASKSSSAFSHGSSGEVARQMPAFATIASMRPKRAMAASTKRRTSAGRDTSASTASTRAPSRSSSAASAWTAGSTSQRARAAPSAASSRAMPAPMPCAAPVTAAAVPSSRFMRAF